MHKYDTYYYYYYIILYYYYFAVCRFASPFPTTTTNMKKLIDELIERFVLFYEYFLNRLYTTYMITIPIHIKLLYIYMRSAQRDIAIRVCVCVWERMCVCVAYRYVLYMENVSRMHI